MAKLGNISQTPFGGATEQISVKIGENLDDVFNAEVSVAAVSAWFSVTAKIAAIGRGDIETETPEDDMRKHLKRFIAQTVVSWDLKDDDGEPLGKDFASLDELDLDDLSEVGALIFRGISESPLGKTQVKQFESMLSKENTQTKKSTTGSHGSSGKAGRPRQKP